MASDTGPRLSDLPFDILDLISKVLPNSDLKNIRLASKAMCNYPLLRFDRVFISAFEKDLDAAEAITSHPFFYKDIKEIVWDDTSLEVHFLSWLAWENERNGAACANFMTKIYEEYEQNKKSGRYVECVQTAVEKFKHLKRLTFRGRRYGGSSESFLDTPRSSAPHLLG
ncbi:hypothetical protein AJ80_06380 [Polytolypa hystricis UAMH7299]|uniref:F-box domain-containing protein n=1 Tax=Polytolypa hystricis (strain UAMH7299) TaxID=1447883 RepID=A0A2B7XW87_POLH7|nr:hypothetical protein AJ80_06380 [Polytolypa hystricis UAMH7299]